MQSLNIWSINFNQMLPSPPLLHSPAAWVRDNWESMLPGLLQDPVHVLSLGNCRAKQNDPHHAIWNMYQLDDINRRENPWESSIHLTLSSSDTKFWKKYLSSLSQTLNSQVPKFAQERKLLINRNIFSYSSKEAEASILLVEDYRCFRL